VLGRRRPSLNARALLGGLLITVSAVGLFAAYTQAGADHRIAYVVAGHDLVPGERLDAGDLTTRRMELPADMAGTFAFRDPARLDGAVMVAPLRAGELVQASDVVAAAGAPDVQEVSFSVDPARAVGGALQPGETVAVVATYGTGAQAVTEVVVPLAQVVSVGAGGGAFGSRTTETVTLGVADAADVLAVTNAVDAGQVELVRTRSPDTGTQPFRPSGSAP
jgi:Flp pilus assembly protein CpaB